jgi:hypothetical protein
VGLLYQHFGVTAPTAKAITVVLQNFFGDCVVEQGIWPPRSPYLKPPELFSWTFLKKVFSHYLTIDEKPKHKSEQAVAGVDQQILRRFARNDVESVKLVLKKVGDIFSV